MLPPVSPDAPAPLVPLPALIGLEDWPHLRFGFAVEPGDLHLRIAMSFVAPPPPPPSGEAGSDNEPATTDLDRYRGISEQWAEEIEVALDVSFCVGPLSTVGALPPHAILRRNALAIVDLLKGSDASTLAEPIELAPLIFALPDPGTSPASYPATWLQPLAVALRFRRVAVDPPDTSDPKPDATPPTVGDKPAELTTAPSVASDPPPAPPAPPTTVTPVPPQADAGASPPAYAGFAGAFEAAYARFSWRVLLDDRGAVGGAGFFLLGWQVKEGVQFSLGELAAPAALGFACPLISPVGHIRADISGALLPATFPTRFARAERWSVQDFDLDAELARFLAEVETFLAPERRARAALLEPAWVERCMAAKKLLAGLLAERVVPISLTPPEALEAGAARKAWREACRDDLRNFHRIGAVAVLQLEAAATRSAVVHGRFVPDASAAPDLQAGACGLAARNNVVAFPILVAADKRGHDLELAGAFRCEAIEPVGAPFATDGQAGPRLRFASEADTRVPAPPLRTRVPVRTMPRPPDLLRQTVSTLEGDDVTSAKSWKLECGYTCESLPQDTLRFGVAFLPPAGGRAAGAAPGGAQSPDLLDALVIFRASLPAIATVLDRELRAPLAGASAPSPDSVVGEAIRAFVMLVEWVAQHFNPPEPMRGGGLDDHEERRDVTPPSGDPIIAGPFDITLRQQARCSLQIVRNLAAGLPPAFHYPTRVVSAADALRAVVDRELELDLATLPPLEFYMPDGPARGSLLDCLTRLLRAVIAAPGPAESAPLVSVGLKVQFSAPLAGTGDDGLRVRMPVALVPPRPISAARRLMEMRFWARPVAEELEAWLARNDPRLGGGFERTGARFEFELTLHAAAAPEASGSPWLRWRGLYFRCPAVP